MCNHLCMVFGYWCEAGILVMMYSIVLLFQCFYVSHVKHVIVMQTNQVVLPQTVPLVCVYILY